MVFNNTLIHDLTKFFRISLKLVVIYARISFKEKLITTVFLISKKIRTTSSYIKKNRR